MGQAKLRGSKEERTAAAIALRQEAERLEQERQQAVRLQLAEAAREAQERRKAVLEARQSTQARRSVPLGMTSQSGRRWAALAIANNLFKAMEEAPSAASPGPNDPTAPAEKPGP